MSIPETITTTEITPVQAALWANEVQRLCLQECGGDVESALTAAEQIVSTQSVGTVFGIEPTPTMQTDSTLKGMYGSTKTQSGKKVKKTKLDSVTADLYPRDKSNRFLDKRTVARYASSLLDPSRPGASSGDMPKFRDSIPEQHRPKLDRLVSQLHSGGTVHHPSENSNLGVDLNGNIPDPDWSYYDWRTSQRNEWKRRESGRGKLRKAVDAATRVVRDPEHSRRLQRSVSSAHNSSSNTSIKETRGQIGAALLAFNTYLGDATDAIEGIASDDASIRALSRALHSMRVDVDRQVEAYISAMRSDGSDKQDRYRDLARSIEDNCTSLLKLFEDILEEEHKRLDEETESDTEPDAVEEPSEHRTIGLSLEEVHTSIALATGVTWQPYTGPRGGRGWKSSTGRIVYGGDKPGTRGEGEEENSGRRKGGGISSVGGGGRADERSTTPVSRDMADEAERPSREGASRVREDQALTPDNKTPRAPTPAPTSSTRPGKLDKLPTIHRGSAERQAVLENVNREFRRYGNHYRSRQQPEIAEWFDDLREHIATIGVDRAASMLSHYNTGSASPTTTPQEKVQYVGTGYFVGDPNVKFLKEYLDEVGITLIPDYRTMKGFDRSKPLVASAPIDNAVKVSKEGDQIARQTNIQTKLEESKLLPGLESSEDIHTVVGHQVSQFTPEVISRLDESYGKGKWIVKSYGDEAYGGFGVFFPQRVKQIQREARQTIYEANKQLAKLGYSLVRGENKKVTGIRDNKSSATYSFSNRGYESIKDERVKKLARQVAASAPQEGGAVLPVNSEVSARQDYGVTFRKNNRGKVTHVVDDDGTVTAVKSPEYDKLYNNKWDDLKGYYIDKTVSAIDHGYASGEDSRFMVQPAFKAVGVSELDRALGFTWETSNEGRVHVSTKDGKASLIPYATMAGRSDAFPVVFANDDIRAMERAVQEAIDALPESERNGQVYSPDVMKTTQGWKVVELNAASEFGQSMWLEENPFVIDAYVSHLAGRAPSHAQFIQSLLQGEASSAGLTKMGAGADPTNSLEEEHGEGGALHGKHGIHGKGPALSTDELGHEHKGKGPGGGQFTKKGGGGSSINKPEQQVTTPTTEHQEQVEQQEDPPSTPSPHAEVISTFQKKMGGMTKEQVATYTMGGCRSFASELSNYLDDIGVENTIVGVVGKAQTPEEVENTREIHVLVKVGDQYLDVTGVKTEEEVLEQWKGTGNMWGQKYEYAGEELRPVPADIVAHGKKWAFREDIRELLRSQITEDESTALSTDDQGHDHAPAGTGKGGQFVKKGAGGSSVGKSNPDRAAQARLERRPPVDRVLTKPRLKRAAGTGPGGPIKTVTSAIGGAVRGALIAGKAAATGKPEMVSREEHQAAVERARKKFENVIVPTAEEVAQNQEGLALYGAQHYRRNLVGNSTDRKRRRDKILKEFGDGVRCPCIYCGILLSGNGDLEQDKMYTTSEGGRYRMSNLVPSCSPCNKRRSDKTFEEAIEGVVKYAGDS